MDAIEVLERQHHHMASLFAAFDYSSILEQEGMLHELLDALALHVDVEAAHFVPALQRRDDAVVKRALAEHARLKETAAPLVGVEGTGTVEDVSRLRSTVRGHIQWEHDVLIPRAAELIDPGQRELVGEAMTELEVELRDAGAPRRRFVPSSEEHHSTGQSR